MFGGLEDLVNMPRADPLWSLKSSSRGDSSASKMLAIQTRGPEFNPHLQRQAGWRASRRPGTGEVER